MKMTKISKIAWKYVLSIILFLCVFNGLPKYSKAASNTLQDNTFIYEIKNDNTLIIKGLSIGKDEKRIYRTITIPNTYNGRKITEIANNALKPNGQRSYAYIKLNEHMKRIGDNNFENSHVEMPKSTMRIETIGKNAFKNAEITTPRNSSLTFQNVKRIGTSAFEYAQFENGGHLVFNMAKNSTMGAKTFKNVSFNRNTDRVTFNGFVQILPQQFMENIKFIPAIRFDSDIKYIRKNAFHNVNLKNAAGDIVAITFKTVKQIDSYAFNNANIGALHFDTIGRMKTRSHYKSGFGSFNVYKSVGRLDTKAFYHPTFLDHATLKFLGPIHSAVQSLRINGLKSNAENAIVLKPEPERTAFHLGLINSTVNKKIIAKNTQKYRNELQVYVENSTVKKYAYNHLYLSCLDISGNSVIHPYAFNHNTIEQIRISDTDMSRPSHKNRPTFMKYAMRNMKFYTDSQDTTINLLQVRYADAYSFDFKNEKSYMIGNNMKNIHPKAFGTTKTRKQLDVLKPYYTQTKKKFPKYTIKTY